MSPLRADPVLARCVLVVLFPVITACATGGDMAECADGSHVQGQKCHLAPDGTYYGDGAEIPDDVADNVADRIDEEADEQSGIEEVEVVEIELGSD